MKIRQDGFAIFLRRKYFLRLWLGSVISGVGSELGAADVLWMTLGVTHSPEALGLISIARGVPGAVASPLATIGRSQLIAELLPESERVAANFFDDVYLHVTWLAGPALAGFAVAWLGYGPVLCLDALSYRVCAGFLMGIPSALHVAGTSVRQLVRNVLDGMRTLVASRVLVQLAVLTFFFNFFSGVYTIALPILARNEYGGARAYGLLWSAFALGSFAGGLYFSRRPWTRKMGPSIASVIALWGVLTILLPVIHRYDWVLVIMAICGLVYTPYEPLYKTMIQQIVPQKMQAKVSSSISPLTGLGSPVGSGLSGWAFVPLGLSGLWFVSGATTVIVGLAAFVTPALRLYDGQSVSQVQ